MCPLQALTASLEGSPDPALLKQRTLLSVLTSFLLRPTDSKAPSNTVPEGPEKGFPNLSS